LGKIKRLFKRLSLSCVILALIGCDSLVNPSSIQSFSLTRLDGATIRVVKSDNPKVLVFHLWATWCNTCMEELPGFLEFSKSLPETDYEVYLIAVKDKKSEVRKAINEYSISQNVYLDSLGRTMVILGTTGVPFTAFADNQLKLISISDPLKFESPSLRKVTRFHGPRDWLNKEWLNLFFLEVKDHFSQ